MKATYNVKLVLALVIVDILLELLEPSGERGPLVRTTCLPDVDVARVGHRRDDRSCWVPL